MVKRKQTITVQEALALWCKAGLGTLTPQTVYGWVKDKVIVGKKVVGRVRIDKRKFQQFIKDNSP